MEYASADQLIRRLSVLDKTEATKKLTEFYAKARFRISSELFRSQYTDGSNDGGVDFHYREDSTYFVFQTKYASSPKRAAESELRHELQKLKNTLTRENLNRDAADFVNGLKRDSSNKTALLEILWLTTHVVDNSLREQIQHELDEFRKSSKWSMGIDFVVVDKHALESVIYDVKHGFVPYTGKKILKLESHQWMETLWEDTGVYSVVCTVGVNGLLKWFRSSDDVSKFLQKNVREFLGEKKINRQIAKSYLESPTWFWYKHNGVIIFADNVTIDRDNLQVTLRNPQVVNGGQTLNSLYLAYDKKGRPNNTAKVLLRIYRLPYEDTETYERSIEIISALNSQNKIDASDLRSTDPRQVRLEQLMNRVGDGYSYIRKRSKDARAGKYHISMRNLALLYWVCKKNMPHEGVRGNTEELFEEQTKYDEVFNESAINRDLGSGHVVLNYVAVWALDQLLFKVELPSRDLEFWKYTRWFVLADVYRKLAAWRELRFTLGWHEWVEFVDSDYFVRTVNKYVQSTFRIARGIIPRREETRTFFRKADTVTKFTRKTSPRKFDTLMSAAYVRFERDI